MYIIIVIREAKVSLRTHVCGESTGRPLENKHESTKCVNTKKPRILRSPALRRLLTNQKQVDILDCLLILDSL
jgi:hypothetical protein